MKNYLFIVIIILAFSTAAFAQAAAADTSAKDKTPAESKEPSDVKTDKFEPTRDPVADLKGAVELAQAGHKRIILDVGGEWCIWCHYLDNFFEKNPELLKLRDDKFVWLKINMSRENENKPFLASYPEVPGYPHLFVLESDGTFLYSQPTDVLELGKSYNPEKVRSFLTKWSPPPPPAAGN